MEKRYPDPPIDCVRFPEAGEAAPGEKLPRVKWEPLIDYAAVIVRSYDTPVTLRQLFYRLVSRLLLPNTRSAYVNLSRETARARREGRFPDLIDETRTIYRHRAHSGSQNALEWLTRTYRRDRTAGQPAALYLGCEKRGIVAQLDSWFGDPLGIPILPLGGYSSQSYVDRVILDVQNDPRPAALLYAGDFDPSGEDIERDLKERESAKGDALGELFDQVIRIALTWDQVIEYGLPAQQGKAKDARAAGFLERHGALIQVEVDALDADVLRDLFAQRIGEHFDLTQFEAVIAQERTDRGELAAMLDR